MFTRFSILNDPSRLTVVAAVIAWSSLAFGQCDPTVPTFIVDLSASPDATYLSPNVQRQDNCCGTVAPDACVQFILTLHPQAQGIIFNICSGAMPTGSMYYQVACGPSAAVGSPLCLTGAGPHIITFCKPGGNNNEYCITSLGAPIAGADIGVNDGCIGTISSSGFDPTTVLWTSVAPGAPGAFDGYLACPTCPITNVVAQPGYPLFVDYRICGAALGACGNTPTCDTLRVYFFSTLTASILPIAPTVCYGATGTTITAVGGGGTAPYSYLWNTGETTASIYADVGSYTVQISDTSGCPPVSASVIVTEFTQPIQALAGTDIVVCGGDLPVQLNASVTGASGGQWITGGGTFLPSNTDLAATYLPTPAEIAAGSVSLVLATTGNGTCPGDQDDVVITFTNSFVYVTTSTIDATCANGNDGSANVLPVDPSFSYLWDDPAAQTNSTATGLAAGTYSVTVTDAFGCDTSMSVTIDEPVAITLASLTTTDETCAGFDNGTVTATAQGGTAPYTYSWSNGGSGPMITVGAGSYTVTVTDANGCAPAQGTATVNAIGQPNIANAGADLIGCMNHYPIPVQGAVQNATGGVWSGGNGTIMGSGLSVQYMPSAGEIAAGGVNLTLMTTGNTTCPPASDVVHITLSNSFLTAALTTNDASCNGVANGSIAFTPSSFSFTYQWNDPAGQTTATALGLQAGTYSVTVTDALGCDTTLTATIGEPATLAVTQVNTTDATCAGFTNGGASLNIAGGTAPYGVLWSNGQTGVGLINVGAGTYGALVTDAQGCTVQTQAVIDQPPAITLIAQGPGPVCVNTPVTLSALASGGTGTFQYNWGGLGFTSSITVAFQASQIVQVSVTDQAGCTGPTVILPITVLDLNAATLTTYGDTVVCPGGGPATVGASLIGYPGNYTITWPELGATGIGPFTVPIPDDRQLTVLVTDQCGNTVSAVVNLLVDAPPNIALPPIIAQGCAPLHVQMPDLQLGPGISYHWNLGNGTLSGFPTPDATYPAGTYSVSLTITTAAGCTTTTPATGQVISYAPPTAAFTSSASTTDFDNANVVFNDQSSGNINTWDWTFGDGGTSDVDNPTHHYQDLGFFTIVLLVTDVHGCTSSATQFVTITPVYDVVVPNAFTPNPNGGGGIYDPNDLNNDVFYAFARFVKDFRMRIFNRWGELIFESTDLYWGWDGYYKGQLSPQDVYVVQTWVRFVDGRQKDLLTDLTLFR